MKKVWKIVISAILLIGLAGAGTAYYFLKVKTYDVADEELEEVTESEYEIILPGDSGADDQSSNDSGGQGSDAAEGDESKATDSQDSTGSKDVRVASYSADEGSEISTGTGESSGSKASSESSAAGQSGSVTTTPESNEVTIGSIKDKYRPSFENLQSQADAKINALVSRAASEYVEKKQSGEKISVAYFYQKYSGAGSELESKTDAAFQTIYSALQNDLKQNGFSPSHAEEFQKEYETAKEARESALISKAKEAL
ncbi:hypothetical protein [Cytobacillus sp. NCCP-133]|uniref:hypothetical protein n=1 Tax=Cytobacillus sp. NCCP-133 TaxID=766848 RepID=UPI00222EAECD|nr:hypothetical protein [Cytobacillus sp. NCCP-133]GLB58996.1 hypothetical protein NCCP133_11290 [Cytobacillus sp. NCCP-133]